MDRGFKFKLPHASRVIIEHLETHGKKTQREIIQELGLPTRTVRYTLRRLLERGILGKYPNLSNMRSVYFGVNDEVLRALGEDIYD